MCACVQCAVCIQWRLAYIKAHERAHVLQQLRWGKNEMKKISFSYISAIRSTRYSFTNGKMHFLLLHFDVTRGI